MNHLMRLLNRARELRNLAAVETNPNAAAYFRAVARDIEDALRDVSAISFARPVAPGIEVDSVVATIRSDGHVVPFPRSPLRLVPCDTEPAA